MSREHFILGICIATKDRPDSIASFVKKSIADLEKYNVGLYIVDGSETETTESVLQDYDNHLIKYNRMPGKSLAYRTIKTIEKMDCDYIMIAGDSRKINFDRFSSILSLCAQGYSLIQTYGQKPGLTTKEYLDIVDMYKDCSVDAVVYSTTVFKKGDYCGCFSDEFLEKYGKNVFFYLILYYACFSGSNFKGYYISENIQIDSLRKRKSWWMTPDAFYQVWGHDFIEVTESLPNYFGESKMALFCDEMQYGFHFDSELGFIYLRINNCLNEKIYSENKGLLDVMSQNNKINIQEIVETSKFRLELKYARHVKSYRKQFVKKIIPTPLFNFLKSLKIHCLD